MPRNIRHPNRDNQTDRPAKEPRDRITDDRGGSVVCPLALPNHGAPGNHGQARQDEHYKSDVGELGPEVAGGEDDDEAEATEGELEEDGLEGVPTEGVDDERPEATDGTVHRVSINMLARDVTTSGVLLTLRPSSTQPTKP